MSGEGSHGERQFAFKIVLIGDGAVGKTALVNRFMEGKFRADYLPTIGSQVYTRMVVGKDGTKITLVVWDISGQPAFNTIRPAYYRGAAAILLVYDLTRIETFQHLDGWLDEVKRHSPSPEIILLGNKSDLEAERRVPRKSGEEYASKVRVSYLETSAKDGSNVLEAFAALANRLVMKIPGTQIKKPS
jgi:small GTP-binding protein